MQMSRIASFFLFVKSEMVLLLSKTCTIIGHFGYTSSAGERESICTIKIIRFKEINSQTINKVLEELI